MTQRQDIEPSDSKKTRMQFGIGRLMVLTATVAVIMTIAVRINAPKIAQGLLVGYLFFIAIWAVVRGPGVVSGLADVNQRRRQLKRRRIDLEREMQQRIHCRESKPTEDGGASR
jgi:hypothetical protein